MVRTLQHCIGWKKGVIILVFDASNMKAFYFNVIKFVGIKWKGIFGGQDILMRESTDLLIDRYITWFKNIKIRPNPTYR